MAIGEGPIGSRAIGASGDGASSPWGPHAGALSQALGAIIADGAGSVTVRGQLSATLSEIGLFAYAAAGNERSGALSQTLGPIVAAGTGEVTPINSGELDATLGDLTAAAVGTVRHRSSGAAALLIGA